MGCDVHDSTTTITQQASSTISTTYAYYTPEVYLDLGDDDSDGQDEADASSIVDQLSAWAPTYTSMAAATTTEQTVGSRPTIVNTYPIGSISCNSSTTWVSADQMTSAASEFCARIGGTSLSIGTSYAAMEGSEYVTFTIGVEPTCSDTGTTFRATDCESIYSQIAAACVNTSGGVKGGSTCAASCFQFGVQMLSG